MTEESTNKPAGHWPPQPIDPATISADDRNALDVRLDTMARAIARALDFNIEQRAKEGLSTDQDTALMSPPLWPSHGCLENWIVALQQARAILNEGEKGGGG